MTGRHRPVHWWNRHPVAASVGMFGALGVATVAFGALVGPSPDVPTARPITPSIGTAHASGIKPWPTVVPPTIGASGAWETQDGPVIVNGKPLPAPTTTATRRTTSSPTTTAAATTTSSPPEVQAAEQADPDPQPRVAAQLLVLVNADRATAGCQPVTLDPSLQDQSQAWSDQQATDNRMYHSPGVTGFDTWGENVAYGYQTAAETHEAWMASPGHRANILDCAFTLMGAAAADGSSGRYWTEDFAA